MSTHQPPIPPATPAEELSAPECWALLRDEVVGRLAVVQDDRPDIFPVNFVVDRGTVVFRTGSGALFGAAAGHHVAFEVDGYVPAGAGSPGRAWSVVLRGRAREIRDVDEVLDLLASPLHPWHQGAKPRVVRIEPDSLSGRRFAVRDGAQHDPSSTAT